MKTSHEGLYFKRFFSRVMLLGTMITLCLGSVGCNTPPNESDTLNALVTSPNLNQSFAPERTSYSITVDADATSVSVTPSAYSKSEITIKVGQEYFDDWVSGTTKSIDIVALPFDIEIIVSADLGLFTTYTINVNDAPASNAFLTDISFFNGQIFPAITDGEVLDSGYEATFPSTTAETLLTAVLSDLNASMTIDGEELISGERSGRVELSEGNNNVNLVVTAEDGITTSTYKLNLIRSEDDEFAYHTYVKASNTGDRDFFGQSIAMWGNTLVVGTPLERGNASGVNGDDTDDSLIDAGAAYVYVKDENGIWEFQAYLKAPNPNSFDNFGISVAIANSTIAIGAWGEDSNSSDDDSDNSASNSGAVYIYNRDESNNWNFSDYLKASNLEAGDQFGRELALSATHLAIGAPLEDSSSVGINGDSTDNQSETSGAVFIFALNEQNEWQEQSYIKASNTEQLDFFGNSITLSGNTLAVGSQNESSNATGVNGNQADNTLESSGAVYVFAFENNSWSQQSYIKASNTDAFDRFGASLALSGNTLVVTSHLEDSDGEQESNNLLDSGATYVFVRGSDLTWTQQAYLKASNLDASLEFGSDLFITGDMVVVGMRKESSGATGIDGDQLDVSSTTSGASYLFSRTNNVWTQQNYIKSSNTDPNDLFGSRLTGYADDLVFSADGEDSDALFGEGNESDNSLDNSGAAYIYRNAPVTNHNLALTTVAFGSSPDKISLINLDTGLSLNDCDDNCSQLIDRGQTVQLTPVAGDGTSEFANWKGDEVCSSNVDSSGVSTVTVNGDIYCLAVFAEVIVEDILLTISKADASTADGLIEATDPDSAVVATCDIGCRMDTSSALVADSIITITATPEAGAEVTVWTGDEECQANASQDNTTTSVTMLVSKTCTAQFDLLGSSTLRYIVANSSGGSGIINATNLDTGESYSNCLTDCSEQINIGQTVSLFASPLNASSQFTGWSGDPACTTNVNPANTANVLVNADTTCTASFSLLDSGEINITLSKADDQTGDGNIDAVLFDALLISCPAGCTSVTSVALDIDSFILLFAAPDSLSEFVEWSGDAECIANASGTQTSVTLDVAKTCTAKFDSLPTKVN